MKELEILCAFYIGVYVGVIVIAVGMMFGKITVRNSDDKAESGYSGYSFTEHE